MDFRDGLAFAQNARRSSANQSRESLVRPLLGEDRAQKRVRLKAGHCFLGSMFASKEFEEGG